MVSGNGLVATYFDGTICPVCRGHTLRERHFEIIDNSRKGISTANLAYCGRQIVIGMILEGSVSDWYADRPEWFFYKHSNFWCPECLSEPDRPDRFVHRAGPPGETWVDFDCSCGFVAVIRVLPRRVGVHPTPQVLPPDDRAPEMAEYAGRLQEEDVFYVHDHPESIDQFAHQVYDVFKSGKLTKKKSAALALPERTPS